MIDPWSRAACVPDGSKYTIPFTLKASGSVAPVGGAGSCLGVALGLQPNALYCEIRGTAATPPAALTWNASPVNASLMTYYSDYRVVSAGIRAWYTGATLNDQGVIIVGQLPESTPLSALQSITSANLISSSAYSKVGALRDGASITWRPDSEHEQADWYDLQASAQVTTTALDHTWLYAIAFEASVIASIQYEIILNCEGYVDFQGYIPGGIGMKTTEAAAPGWYEKTANVIKDIPAYVSYAGQAMSTVNNALNAFGSVSMTQMGANLIKNSMLLGRNRRIAG
jgi:hypothetical protein